MTSYIFIFYLVEVNVSLHLVLSLSRNVWVPFGTQLYIYWMHSVLESIVRFEEKEATQIFVLFYILYRLYLQYLLQEL